MTEPPSSEMTEIETEFASVRFRLSYADCDPAGIVYFASWFPWMERLLSEWMYDHSLRSDQLFQQHGFMVITCHAECEYLYPASLFDPILVTMNSAKIGKTSLKWGFEIIRTTDELLVGRGQLIWVTIGADGAPVPVPSNLVNLVQKHHGGG